MFHLWELYERGSRCGKESTTDDCPLGLWMIGATTSLFSFAFLNSEGWWYSRWFIIVVVEPYYGTCFGHSLQHRGSHLLILFNENPSFSRTSKVVPNTGVFQLHKFMLGWLTGDRNSIKAVQLHEEDCLGAICHLWDFLCRHMLVFNTWLCTLVMNKLHYHHRKVSAWLSCCIIMIGNSTILAGESFWLVEFSITISYHGHCHKYNNYYNCYGFPSLASYTIPLKCPGTLVIRWAGQASQTMVFHDANECMITTDRWNTYSGKLTRFKSNIVLNQTKFLTVMQKLKSQTGQENVVLAPSQTKMWICGRPPPFCCNQCGDVCKGYSVFCWLGGSASSEDSEVTLNPTGSNSKSLPSTQCMPGSGRANNLTP